MINYEALPAIYRGRVQAWITKGVDPGPFLRALFAGDLFDVMRHASDFDHQCLGNVTTWLIVNEDVPELCYGSWAKVDNWLTINSQRLAAERAVKLRPDAGELDPALAVTPAVEEGSPVEGPTPPTLPRGRR